MTVRQMFLAVGGPTQSFFNDVPAGPQTPRRSEASCTE